jgi:hypothetical protein
MTTTMGAVATQPAIEMIPDDSAPGRVAIAGRTGGGTIVGTFGTPARIGDSSDSSGVEGGKRSRDEPQRHKRHEGRDCFDGLSLCVFVPYVMSGTAARYRSRLLSHAPELIIEVDAYFVALDGIYEIGHRLKMTPS